MRGLLFGSALLLCGCAYVGDPLPPALNIPEKITDLRAVQRGDRILIDFTIPQLTTEGLPVRKLGGVDLRIGSTAVPVQGVSASVQIPSARDWYDQEVIVRVRLLNSNGRPSDWSNLVTLAVTQPLATPADLSVSSHAKGVAVTWKAPPRDKLQFRVFRRAGDEKESTVVATVDRPEYIDAAVALGKQYEYTVQAVLGSAESEPAAPIAAVARDVSAPDAPAGLNAVGSLNSIELGWERNAESDLAHYRVYRADAEGAFTVIADMVENPAFSDRQVTSGKTYRYAVSAVDRAANEGEKTPPVQAVAP